MGAPDALIITIRRSRGVVAGIASDVLVEASTSFGDAVRDAETVSPGDGRLAATRASAAEDGRQRNTLTAGPCIIDRRRRRPRETMRQSPP